MILTSIIRSKSMQEHPMSDNPKERRGSPRHRAESGAYAVIDERHVDIGHIIDISDGGISFIYAGSDIQTNEALDLSIYLYNQDLFIKKIPSRVVSNFKIQHEKLFDFVVLMRCSLKFDNLDKTQKEQLAYLIKNFTSGLI